MTVHTATHEANHMPSAIFDTLAYCKKLRAAGVPEVEAEIHAEALAEIIDQKLSTKKDLKNLEKELKRDIKELKQTLTSELTIRLGSMLIVATMVLAALIKIL